MKNIKKSTWIKAGVLVAIILIYIFVTPFQTAVKRSIFVLSMLDVEAVKQYILSFGIWAPVVSFLLMMLQSVAAPLPAFLLTFANAALFGWVNGAILSWTSAMAGAILCFYISKIYGRGTAEKFASKFALDQVDQFFERYGNYAILIARLLPFVSFDIVSYAAGLTSMGLWSFVWATGLGQLPATLVYSYAGEMLTGGVKTFVTGLLIVFAVSILGYVIKKVMDDKNKKKLADGKITKKETV